MPRTLFGGREVVVNLKGKSSLMIFDRHANLKYKYGFNPKFVEGYRKKAEGHVYKLKGKIDYAALMDPKFAEDEEDE